MFTVLSNNWFSKYSGDLDRCSNGKRASDRQTVWYSNDDLSSGPLLRPPFEYRTDIQMPSGWGQASE